MPTVAERIKNFNANRNPEFVQMKFRNMSNNAFSFYRGTCHLFYEDLPTESIFKNSPQTWVCGDLHLENFGSYKANNGGFYFDITDFDESILAPCLYDVSRLLVSILLATGELKIGAAESLRLGKHFLDTYSGSLADGYTGQLESAITNGFITRFLRQGASKKREEYIKERTVKTDGKRLINIDNKHTAIISSNRKIEIATALESWAKTTRNPEFYALMDASYRIAGTGSLGLERYQLLVVGNGKNEHYLLDMKISNPSCLSPYLTVSQPQWANEAERVISIRKRYQAARPDLLDCIEFKRNWFVLTELLPSYGKIDLTKCNDLKELVANYALLLAWAQLRSGGRENSATTDALMAFATDCHQWKKVVLDYSKSYFTKVKTDYKSYCLAYKDGYFNE
jgi:uncharacterized protein (DUF2252 family)